MFNVKSVGTTEASKMLEEALQQMDGIISSTSVNGQSPALTLSERNLISANNVISTAKTLALALQQVGVAAPAPDPVTAAIISDWLDNIPIPRQDSDERLRRLQRDKESLALQYQMLAERVSEQADKIIELEGLLTEKTQELCTKEEQLQRQMISQSALETQKLELMSALSELKLHRAALERENIEFDHSGSTNDESTLPFGSLGSLSPRKWAINQTVCKTPPATSRHQIKPQFHSLPRSHAINKTNANCNNNNNSALDANANSGKHRNVAFALNENTVIDESTTSCLSKGSLSPSPSLRERSARGIRSLFGKLRRSNSGNMEMIGLEQSEGEFKRGGFSRATAGGRIEWTSERQMPRMSNFSKDYREWTPQEVCNWLVDLGLGCYEDTCKKWLKTNPSVSFFNVSPVDIEKELHIKMPLHRKKIMLAIDELSGKEIDQLALKAGRLDTSWVLRWLDDIGLPQYKDNFIQAKVDGRMLHRLTLEDLAQMRISSCLHIASLRCAIRCMRDNLWKSECLIRRSMNPIKPSSSPSLNVRKSTEELNRSEENNLDCIILWTTHRVMEWLRVADLSEYAPNLRGAGVHGALMIYDQCFNAELLADLLSIPPSKSLLRRHIATHFKELLGRDAIQNKRNAEAQPGHQPLTITAKIKPPKKSQFSLKRRKSHKGTMDIDWTEYVCPMTNSSAFAIAETFNEQLDLRRSSDLL